jgi:hypothetical protein
LPAFTIHTECHDKGREGSPTHGEAGF